MAIIASDLRLYRLQIMNFLTSMTIKYSPMADQINKSLVWQGQIVDENNPQTWKYYLNLTGQYHASDTVMTIMSLDTRTVIDFTVDNLALHQRTKLAYIPGSTYYDKLCERYPAQVDLVKSIVFPVADIEAAIDADDFTILNYGEGFLESTEEGYILSELTQVLRYIADRWYLNYLSYEPYFYMTFWGQLWHRLTEACFTARFKAIRTINVHSWHVWQYIQSNGLGDYSDILTREKAMFLYRNLEYLIENRGKQSNLQILATHLLGDLSVGLFGRDVYQQTRDGAAQYQLIPELVASSIAEDMTAADESVPAESVDDMNSRLVEAGDEIQTSAEWVRDVSSTLSATNLNTYPTKLLELRPLPRDRKYADFFNVFIMDTLVYLISQNYYRTTIELYTSDTSDSVEMSAQDALILLYFCISRTQYQTPTNLPTVYTSRAAYKLNPPQPPATFKWSNMTYYLRSVLDVDVWYKQSAYPPGYVTLPTQFSDIAANLFLVAVGQIIESRNSSDLVANQAMRVVEENLFCQETFTLNPDQTLTTYDQWFANHYDIQRHYVDEYEALASPQEKYSELADLIISQLVPINSIMEVYGNFSISDQGYSKLKDLFISLCSYNVTFLNTTRDVYQFILVEEMAVGSLKKSLANTTSVPPTIPVDLHTTATSAMDMDAGDVEIDLYTTGSTALGVEIADQFTMNTTASNRCAEPDALPISARNRDVFNAIGVSIDDVVTVGSE